MSDTWKVVLGIIGVVVVVVAIGYSIYWRYQHPCLRYEPVWKDAWTEIQTRHISCGKDCSTVIVVPVYHPAHWEQHCMFYGDRSKGDVEANYAPIPAER